MTLPSLNKLTLVLFILAMQIPQAQATPCGMNCQVNQPTVEDIANILNDLVESHLAPVVVTEDEESGVITVTLNDGTQFSIETVGLMLMHQNMQQGQINQAEDGSFRMHSQSGQEVQIRAAIHHEEEMFNEMYRLGWTDFDWSEGGFEANSPDGDRLCLTPDMVITSESPIGMITVSFDNEDNVIVNYGDGIQQRLHACSHDLDQLSDHIRSLTEQQIVFSADGTFSLEIDNELVHFRLHSILSQSDIHDQPGFFSEDGKIYFRYRDGWEQEIIILS